MKASNSIGLGRVAKALLDDDLPDGAAGAASGPAEGDR